MKKHTVYQLAIGTLLVALGAISVYVLKPVLETRAGFGIPNLDIFEAYGSWPGSGTLKSTDTMAQALFSLASNSNAWASSMDINGDGLADVVKHEINCMGSNGTCRLGVFLNKGNFTFDLVYKCRVESVNDVKTYYGDCAG